MQNNNLPEKLLTVQEVASIFKVNKMTVYRMVKDGRLKGFRFGRQWRIELDAVNDFIARDLRQHLDQKFI